MPKDLHGFEGVLEAARVDQLSPEDMDNYQDMLTAVKNEMRSARLYDLQQARKKGKAEGEAIGEARGEAKGRVEERSIIAKAMKDLDIPIEKISQASGLSLDEIAKL